MRLATLAGMSGVERSTVVIGGGLAGLSCARDLVGGGERVVVLEAGDAVGGRVRTDEVEGFRLDRGFQVYLSSYPEASRVLDHAGLELRAFEPGAMVWCEGKFHRLVDPWRRPGGLLDGALAKVGTLGDKLKVGAMRSELSKLGRGEVFGAGRPERTIAEALEGRGFSRGMVERFFRPFFGGITLDGGLGASSRMMEFVFGCFARGDACVPRLGMGEIPKQVARAVVAGGGSVRLGARAVGLERRGEGWGVMLSGGEVVTARRVVVATEGRAAQRLLHPHGCAAVTGARGGARWGRAWRGVTCVYFAVEGGVRGVLREPMLLLNGEMRGGVEAGAMEVVNVACMSSVSGEGGYAPAGSGLVSCTVLGAGGVPSVNDAAVEVAVRGQMAGWFGAAEVGKWRVVRVYRIAEALPDQSPPWYERGEMSPWLGEGLLRAGDDAELASIDGAVLSGRRAAAAVLGEAR